MGETSTRIFHFSAFATVLVLLCPRVSTSERRIDPEFQQVIDDFVNNIFLPQAEVTGLVLTFVQNDGEILYTTGYGLSNIEKGYVNGNRTQFGLGSISKSFTSLLVAKVLYEAFPHLGEAVLDTPIRRLLPIVNLTLIDRFRSEHSTFRDLLAHLTCVTDQPIVAEPFSSMEEYLYRARYNPEMCGIRTTLSYNNQLYAMAGELAALISGKSFEAAMQDLWNDIGMLDTTFVQDSDNFTELPLRAMPYYMKDNEAHLFNPDLVKRIKLASAAGGVFSTSDDMARYMRFHMNRGNIDGKQVIPEEVMKWLTKPSFAFPDQTFKNSDDDSIVNIYGYGLGLLLGSWEGWEYNLHPGSLLPYDNYMSMWPGKKLAIYTGTHQNPKRFSDSIIHLLIYEILSGNVKAQEKVLHLMKKMDEKRNEKNKKAKDDWETHYRKMVNLARNPVERKRAIQIGKYGSGSAGDLELSERFNQDKDMTQYFIQYGKWYHGWLELVPGETSLFKIHWATDAVQEDYALGLVEGRHFATIAGDDTITLEGSYGLVGVFKLGEGLDMLPVIPWDPNSC